MTELKRVVSIELSLEAGDWPAEGELRERSERAIGAAVAVLDAQGRWRRHSRQARGEHGGAAEELELSLLFTDDAAIRRLNNHYRGKDKPTNVLSFPQAPGPHAGALLGDVILAVETTRREAALAGKPFEDHMAHLLIHGFLHLLGYDHETDGDAEEMEALERSALESIGIADPTAAAHGA